MKFLLPMLFLVLLPLAASAADPMATVTRQQGGAEVETPVQRPLQLGGSVAEGDVVRTETDARLAFLLTDGTELSLGGDTRFAFDAGLLAEEGGHLRMLSGAFRLITGALPPGRELTVETPLGVIGIRGTDFWGGFFDQDEVGVFLFEGHAITVTNAMGKVELQPGQGTFLRSGQAPTPPGAWGSERLERAAATVAFD